MGFAGFGPGAFAWFSGLEDDNSRAWFSAHRAAYDAEVRGPLTALLEELAAPGDGVHVARQHRDTRFTKDKAPYKTRSYGVVGDRRYAEIAATGLFAGTGYRILMGDQLARFRDAVDDEAAGAALAAIVADLHGAGVETFGEALKTAPRGYDRDHPRVALLRHKMLIAGARLAPAAGDTIPRNAALAHARNTWAACAPLMAWLDAHVGPARVR
jgi:uncharacterized protein (TIGR02453 family)